MATTQGMNLAAIRRFYNQWSKEGCFYFDRDIGYMGNHIAVYKINAKVKKVLKDNGYEERDQLYLVEGKENLVDFPDIEHLTKELESQAHPINRTPYTIDVGSAKCRVYMDMYGESYYVDEYYMQVLGDMASHLYVKGISHNQPVFFYTTYSLEPILQAVVFPMVVKDSKYSVVKNEED